MARDPYVDDVFVEEREGKYGKFPVIKFTKKFFDNYLPEHLNEDGSFSVALFKTKDGSRYYLSLWKMSKPQEEVANTAEVPQPQEIPKVAEDDDLPF